MVTGVKGSELVSDLLEGKQQKVPVGRRVVYHEIEKNDAEVLPQTAGQELTHLHISQFDAFGLENESLAAKRDEHGNEVEFNTKDVQNDGLVAEAAFQDGDGKLVLVRRDGTTLEIDGFLSQSDFGTGLSGPRGNPGLEGDDAFDGEDGSDGGEGCAGEEGGIGELGPLGKTETDGVQGIPGPLGGPGPPGPQGPPGKTGRFGHEGGRGRTGSSCGGGGSGGAGEDGQAPIFNVVISSEPPQDSKAVLWGVLE